jgi:hypothetical protein
MMEVPMTLVRVRRQEGTRCRFGLCHEVRGALREREDMLVLHIVVPLLKHTGRANAAVSPLKLGEVFLQIVPITQSQSLLYYTKQRCAHLRTSRADC